MKLTNSPNPAKFTASVAGIADIPIDQPSPKTANQLINLLPRPRGLELRKGFKHYQTFPSLDRDITEPVSLFALDKYNQFLPQGQSWSMLFAISHIPYVFELNQDTPLALTDYSPVLLSTFNFNTEQGIVPADRMDFPKPSVTEYTDFGGQTNLVICSDPTLHNPAPGAINGLWVLKNKTDPNSRVPFSTTYVPQVWTAAGVDDLKEWGPDVVFLPGESALYEDKAYELLGDVAFSGEIPPDKDTKEYDDQKPSPTGVFHWKQTRDALHQISTNDFSFPIFHDNRLFFIKHGTNIVYYSRELNYNPDENMIVNRLRVGKAGGNIIFATELSSESTNTVNTWLVFVTADGLVHMYANFDAVNPLNNVYKGPFYIGKPLGGKQSFMDMGGDTLVATEWGLISLQACINDTPITGGANVAQHISDTWRELVEKTQGQGDWFVQKDPTADKIMVISPAGQSHSLVWCLDTKGWAYIDKSFNSVIEYAGKTLYSTDTDIFTYEGGLDSTAYSNLQIEGLWVPQPSDFGSNVDKKVDTSYLRYTSLNDLNLTLECVNHDFPLQLEPPPTAFDGTPNPTSKQVREPYDTTCEGTLLGPALQVASNQEQDSKFTISSVTLDIDVGGKPPSSNQ